MNEVANNSSIFLTLAPYITSIVCAAIAGIASYLVAKKQLKASVQQLTQQHALDIEKEREKFELDKERLNIEHQNQLEQQREKLELEFKHQLEMETTKLELEHKHQMELLQAQSENQMGSDLITTLMKEIVKTPEGKNMIRNAARKQ